MSLKIKSNSKALSTMLIVAIVAVIVIVIAGVAAYGYMAQNPADPATTLTPTSTPTAEPSSTESAVPSATEPAETTEPSATVEPSETAVGVSEASSLKFSVNIIENGAPQISYTYMGKNVGTDDFSMSVQVEDIDGETIYIFNGAQHKAWSYVEGEWTDISDLYDMQWSMWNGLWSGYMTNLESWSGTGDYSYGQDGSTVEIVDIEVNPVLDDSLFVHVFV